MDKNILEQYVDIREEERDLVRRIQSLDAKILNMEMNSIVSDTVTRGRHNKKPLGIVRIEGYPSREYQRKKSQLKRLKDQLIQKDAELINKMMEAEKYIEDVTDSRIRQIMRYRYLDDLTWSQISKRMHPETEDSARKALERYLLAEK